MSKVIKVGLYESIVEKFIQILFNCPYVIFLRTLRNQNLKNHVVRIRADVKIDQHAYNAPKSSEVIVVYVKGNNPSGSFEQDILVYSKTGHQYIVKHYYR